MAESKTPPYLPTVISTMHKPPRAIREAWLKKYGRDSFTWEEARDAQTFPETWIFPPQKTKRWKWIAEAFPPKTAEYLFNNYVDGSGNTLLDMFAGIGGWSLGAVWSGRFDKIIMVEWDKAKCEYLRKNFDRLGVDYKLYCGDVRTLPLEKYRHVDVVVASPPCEDVSTARFFNKRAKIQRGTLPLTRYTIRAVDAISPRHGFYENVYRLILRSILEEGGWTCTRFDMSKIIPQRRVRLICKHGKHPNFQPP